MQNETFSAMKALLELRAKLVARLEDNEDFRVLRGLDFVLQREARTAADSRAEAPNAVRAMHDGLGARFPAPAGPNTSSAPDDPNQDSLVFSNLRTGS